MAPRAPIFLSELLRSRSPHTFAAHTTRAQFSTTRQRCAARIYEPIRRPSELETLLLLNASSRTALLTLWTASWCRTCRTVGPIVKEAIEEHANGAGNGERGRDVGFVEIEYDAPENMELGSRYMITSIPTLLAFSRQEAQMGTRVADAKKLADRAFLREWIAREAERGGDGGAGGVGWLGKVMETFRGQS